MFQTPKNAIAIFCVFIIVFFTPDLSVCFADNAFIAPYPSHLVVRRCDFFWTEAGETPVNRISLQNDRRVPLVRKMGPPENFVIHGPNIFWIEQRSGISPSGSCTGPGVIRILNKTSTGDFSTLRLATTDNCSRGTSDIVVDDQYVFWVKSTASPNEYTILRMTLSGGNPTALTSMSSPVVALAGDSGYLYWAEDRFPNPESPSTIRRISKTGGEIQTIAPGLKRLRETLVIRGSEIFFADSNEWNTYRVMKAPLAGGQETTLAEVVKGDFDPVDYVKAMAVDDERVYWVDNSGLKSVSVQGGNITDLAAVSDIPSDIHAGAESVFWTETTGPAHAETGKIKSVPKAGGPVTVWVQNVNAPRKLFVDGNYLYWSEGGEIADIEGFGRIARRGMADGQTETLIAGVSVDNPPIAVDDKTVYFADKFTLKKVPLEGGIPEKLAISYNPVGSIATDGAFLYWVDGIFSTVQKVPVSGGPVEILAGTLKGPSGPVRLYKNYFYWMSNFSEINKVAVSGKEPPETVVGNLPFLDDFVLDENQVFFSEHDTGLIRKVPITGGTPTTLISLSEFASPRSLSVFTREVYWVDQIEVGKIGINGGTPHSFSNDVASDPYFQNSIAVGDPGLYWTEGGADLVVEHPFDIIDGDGDCVSDGRDAFPNDPKDWEDSDQDGIGNNADPDDDDDGMPDDWELNYGLHFLIDDAGDDKDSDGYANLEEYAGGTNPADPSSKPFKKGDLNWNGRVELSDCILALKAMASAGPVEEMHIEADVNGDSKIGIEEIVFILQDIAGLR